jgi:N-acetylglutamate synthase-like GNAT family acetyltransferase
MNLTSTIRIGTSSDVPAVQRLLRDSDPSQRDLPALPSVPGRTFLLVLDAPGGGLAAAAQLTLEDHRGHLGLLAIANPFQGEGLEHRMIGVAEALCTAFGCESLDVPVRRRAA